MNKNNITIDDLKNKINIYNRKNWPIIEKAYHYAYKYHLNQKRESGEEYIIHPLTVSYILSSMHADADTICAALLHDVVEDTKASIDDIRNEFNETVAMLVDGVTKISKMNFDKEEDALAWNIRRIIMSIQKDARIVIIKLVDRLHNMRTLEYKNEKRQQEIALETLEIYVPMAYYIGTYKIKDELENISFKYLKNDVFNELEKKLGEIHKENHKMLNKMINLIHEKLKKEGIKSHIEMHFKDPYSVYKKMITKSSIDKIHDLLGIKIVVSNIKDCYLALMIIHSLFPPYNAKFKDYIVNPKTNMYQSLHTTVFANSNHLVQFQIRTKEMERIATYGLTSYWFKNRNFANVNMQNDLENNFQFFKSIKELDSTITDNSEFVSLVKEELFSNNVYVHTTKGETVELPNGSTPIDFAYKIHTDIGNTMVAAVVNEEIVPFNYHLQNDDRVRIITDSQANVNKKEWLKIVVTTHAKKAINEYLKNKSPNIE